MENFGYYLLMLAAVIAGIYVIKKIASCLIKTIVFVIMLAILSVAYFYFLA